MKTPKLIWIKKINLSSQDNRKDKNEEEFLDSDTTYAD